MRGIFMENLVFFVFVNDFLILKNCGDKIVMERYD